MQGLRLFQQILAVIFHLAAVIFAAGAGGADGGVHQFCHLFSHSRHTVSVHCLCQAVFRFVILVRNGPGLVRNEHLAAAVSHISPVVLFGVDDRFEAVHLSDNPHHRKRLAVDVDDRSHRIFGGIQALDGGAVQDHCLGVVGVFPAEESSSLLHLIAGCVKVSGIYAEHGAAELGVLIVYVVAVGTCAVKGCRFHIVQCGDVVPHCLGDDRHAVRRRLIGEVIGAVALVQLDADRVVSRTDQIVLDLLVCAFDGGNNGDDRRNADDDAQHGENGTHLMGQNAL